MRDKVQKDRTPFPGAKAGQEHSGGVQGGKEFGRTRPGLRISLYPDHPPIFPQEKREYGLRLPVPKKAWGRVDEGRPLPFPKASQGPAGLPSGPAHPAPG